MNDTRTFFDDRGHLTDEGIALFVDALKLGTTGQLPGTMRTHVAECDQCQREVTGLFALLGKEDYSGLETHPFFRLGKERAVRAWRIAAVIAAVVLLPALVYYVFIRSAGEQPAQPGLAASPGDTTAIAPVEPHRDPPGGREEIAANFTPNPQFEALVTAGSRSSALTDVVPVNGAVVGGTVISFNWGPRGSQRGMLVIMEAGGREIYAARVTALPHRVEKRLSAGLYYWKVLDEEEAVHFGKFSVPEPAQSPTSTNPAQK